MTAAAVSDLSDRPESAAPPEGLYLHIPFCVSQCPYCDFVVYAGSVARGPRNRVKPLTDALHAELGLRADLADERFGPPGKGRAPLVSLYVGGGTPSLLPASSVAALIDHAARRFGLAPDAEVTLEANPGVDEIGDVAGFRAAGVTRLSLGAQSMDVVELRALGRRHGPDDVGTAVREARRAGIASLSLDLLTDTPDQSPEGWQRTLGLALDLEPDHLSVYALALDDPDAEGLTGADGDHLPLSRGARAWRERARRRQSQDRAAEMDAVTDEATVAAGLMRYEIANLARSGQECRHNLLYWRRPERAILGLRLSEGLSAAVADEPLLALGLSWARAESLVESAAGRVRLTARGRALSNEVFMRLLPDAAEVGAAGSEK